MSVVLAMWLAVQAPGPGVPSPRASQAEPARPQTQAAADEAAPAALPGAMPPVDVRPSSAQVAPPVESAPPPPELPPFDGLADGLTQLQLAVGDGKTDVAVGIAEALLAPNAWSRARTALETGRPWAARACEFVEPGVRALGIAGPSAAARAEVHYAAGVAFDRGGAPDKARERFVTAAALAGPGELRLDASYNVGAIALGLAERLREAQRQAPPPGALALQAPGHGSSQGAGAAGADPSAMLDQLEAAYRAAKLELVERLKADWHDADVRANLELIQRRLHELEQQRKELEQQKQEEQQQQKQQKQDQQQDSQKSDPEKSDPEQSVSQKSDDQSSEKQDPSSSNEERKDPPQDAESQPEEDQQEGEQQEPKDAEQPKPEEQASESKQDESQDSKAQTPQPAQPEERVLTREELQRILGRLEEIEKEGQAIQARLRRARRASAEKDW
ncbi:MAG: hypothetical protein L6Q99_12925 [Planctomycetes bacterium]|nr:hypothetical protein [Planctomycetota bacterium]